MLGGENTIKPLPPLHSYATAPYKHANSLILQFSSLLGNIWKGLFHQLSKRYSS